MSYSVLQVLADLETSIVEYVQHCKFYFGPEEEHRDAQPPKVVWEIGGGDPTSFERQSAVSGAVYPKSFAADMVPIAAILMGAAVPSAETTEKTQRAQEYAASEHLLGALRWALMRSTARGRVGAHDWQGWQVVAPEGPSDRGCMIEARFAVKVQWVAPEPLISDPPHEVITASVEMETP